MQSKTKDIQDDYGKAHAYEVYLFPAGKGFDYLPVITKILGGPLGDLISTLGGGEELTIDGQALGRAVTALSESLIEKGSSKFLQELLEHTIRDGVKVPAAFDKIYQGNYGELVAAVAWVLECNFAPFLTRYVDADKIQFLTQRFNG